MPVSSSKSGPDFVIPDATPHANSQWRTDLSHAKDVRKSRFGFGLVRKGRQMSEETSREIRREIRRVGVLSAGVVFGAVGAVMALLRALLFVIVGETEQNLGAEAELGQLGPLLIVFLPLFVAVAGFVVGVASAIIYNLIAALLGGVIITVIERD